MVTKENHEGYIKFNAIEISEKPILDMSFKTLNDQREKLYKAGLIGERNGIGYGNVSLRTPDGFIITGSKTGSEAELSKEDYAKIIGFDIRNNEVMYRGATAPSSETMTHAVIYREDPEVNAVVHVHNFALWMKLLNFYPTTSGKVEYGTPEMAEEIVRLYPEAKPEKVICMGGHQDGLLTFGKSIDEAVNVLFEDLEEKFSSFERSA